MASTAKADMEDEAGLFNLDQKKSSPQRSVEDAVELLLLDSKLLLLDKEAIFRLSPVGYYASSYCFTNMEGRWVGVKLVIA